MRFLLLPHERSACSENLQAPVYPIEHAEARSLIHQSRRNAIVRHITAYYSHIPPRLYPYIFPLYHPYATDLLLHWSIPSEERSGFLLAHGPALGAGHGALDTIIQRVEQTTVKRAMYAETHRERSLI